MRKFLRIALVITALLLLTLLLLGVFQRMTPTPHIQAWIYPGPPACSASTEMADGRTIDTLKPQYFTLNDSGTLAQITSGCNSYSVENAALVKGHSRQQFVTIS